MEARDTKNELIWIIGSWIGSHAVLIAGHVLTVLVYSLAVAPGLEADAYSAFALKSGPWFSIVAGGPVFFLVARLLQKKLGKRGRRMALIVWALYSATDLAIVLLSQSKLGPLFAVQWVASQSIKLIAVILATRGRERD